MVFEADIQDDEKEDGATTAEEKGKQALSYEGNQM
jgi:hypothetical protein